jgi:hypothetical protein
MEFAFLNCSVVLSIAGPESIRQALREHQSLLKVTDPSPDESQL